MKSSAGLGKKATTRRVAGSMARSGSNRFPFRHLTTVTLTSLLASLLVCSFFAPRFVVWRGLDIPEAWFYPEVNRAVDTLDQLENPFIKIENPSNQVIAWRLLFPLIGHYLRLPWWLFLALPHIGSLLAVGLIAHVVWRETDNRLWAFMASVVLATSGWFFVSVGWLAYFDSWFVLGLLVAAFIDSRFALAASCLLTPWIDERFLLALPVCLAVRAVRRTDPRGLHLAWGDVGAAGCSLTYVVLRLVALSSIDAGSESYLASTLREPTQVPWRRFLEGLWSGYRAA